MNTPKIEKENQPMIQAIGRRDFLLSAAFGTLSGVLLPGTAIAAERTATEAPRPDGGPAFVMDPVEIFRNKLETYKRLLDKEGEKKAWATLYEGYPERQRKMLGPVLGKGETLAQSFAKGIPMYRQYGMEMSVVDASNNGRDAVLEIQRVCLVLKNNLHAKAGIPYPCDIICQMDIDATEEAFREMDMKGSIISSQARGDCLCIFKYERRK